MRLLAVVLLVVLAACGPGESSEPAGPADQVESLLRAFEDDDCKAARQLVTRPDDLPCAQVRSISRLFENGTLSLDDATFTVKDEGEDSASVDIDLGDDEPAMPYDVVKIGGEWLVELDTAA